MASWLLLAPTLPVVQSKCDEASGLYFKLVCSAERNKKRGMKGLNGANLWFGLASIKMFTFIFIIKWISSSSSIFSFMAEQAVKNWLLLIYLQLKTLTIGTGELLFPATFSIYCLTSRSQRFDTSHLRSIATVGCLLHEPWLGLSRL